MDGLQRIMGREGGKGGKHPPSCLLRGIECMSPSLHIIKSGERLIYAVPPHFAKMSYEEVKK